MTDEDEPLSPAEMLELLQNQQRSVEGQMASFVPVLATMWGVVWLLGFGALWLIDGARPGFSLPLPIAITVFVALLAVAIVASAVLAARSNRGMRGGSDAAFTGTVYGLTWMLGSVAIVVFAQGLAANGMTSETANIFYPIAFVLFAGIMYVIGGAIWHAMPMLVVGVWTVIVSLVAPFFGYPGHYLVLAVGGGGGFLALGIASFVWLASLRRRASGVRRG